MKRLFYLIIAVLFTALVISSCKKDEVTFSPSVPFKVEFNKAITEYQNGDSLYGNVTIKEDSLVKGMQIKKIDCRLGNIVIGTVENKMVCPFGVRLKDKPVGTHTFSVIIKCEAPDCDETFWRHDFKTITIKNKIE